MPKQLKWPKITPFHIQMLIIFTPEPLQKRIYSRKRGHSYQPSQ